MPTLLPPRGVCQQVVCCAARGLRGPTAALEYGPTACGGLPPLLPALDAATPVAMEVPPGAAMHLPAPLWVSPPAIVAGCETDLRVAVAVGEVRQRLGVLRMCCCTALEPAARACWCPH